MVLDYLRTRPNTAVFVVFDEFHRAENLDLSTSTQTTLAPFSDERTVCALLCLIYRAGAWRETNVSARYIH